MSKANDMCDVLELGKCLCVKIARKEEEVRAFTDIINKKDGATFAVVDLEEPYAILFQAVIWSHCSPVQLDAKDEDSVIRVADGRLELLASDSNPLPLPYVVSTELAGYGDRLRGAVSDLKVQLFELTYDLQALADAAKRVCAGCGEEETLAYRMAEDQTTMQWLCKECIYGVKAELGA